MITGACSIWRSCVTFHNKLILYGEDLLVPHPTLKLEDNLFSAVHNCLFNIFAATLHNWRTYIRNLRTCHAVVTRDPPNMDCILTCNPNSQSPYTLHVQDGICPWIDIQQLGTSALSEFVDLDNKTNGQLSFVQMSVVF